MKGVPVKSIIVLLIFAGIVWLQVFLSKMKNKFLGLILPIITFLYSLIIVFNIIVDGMSSGEAFGAIVSALFLANIPTIIFIIIYFVSRENINKNKEIEKMNIQDLD